MVIDTTLGTELIRLYAAEVPPCPLFNLYRKSPLIRVGLLTEAIEMQSFELVKLLMAKYKPSLDRDPMLSEVHDYNITNTASQ